MTTTEDNEARAEHYAYCKDANCAGCLPSDDDLRTVPLIALWGEMVARCIAQTPQTKTRMAAFDAIVADGPRYRELSRRIRSSALGGSAQ